MTKKITVFVAGTPRPQGSKTVFKTQRTGRPILVEASRHAKPWRNEVAKATRDAVMRQGAIIADAWRVDCEYYFARPKSHLNKDGTLRKGAPLQHTSKPDIDKLDRLVFDGITHIAITDDAAIVCGSHSKQYTRGQPGVRITITPAQTQEDGYK